MRYSQLNCLGSPKYFVVSHNLKKYFASHTEACHRKASVCYIWITGCCNRLYTTCHCLSSTCHCLSSLERSSITIRWKEQALSRSRSTSVQTRVSPRRDFTFVGHGSKYIREHTYACGFRFRFCHIRTYAHVHGVRHNQL